jgi:23S rRNA pseudouridine1911/1915/1917 synthase
MSESQHSFVVETAEIVRLDQYLSEQLADVSRSYLKKLISDGQVTIDDIVFTKASRNLHGGETVSVKLPAPEPLEAVAEDIPLDILYEDEHLLVINKAAGMVVHPAAGHSSGTLVNAVLFHCDDLSGIGGAMRPGIVHRLDAGTTGAIIVAKNDRAHLELSRQFREREIEKAYAAVVYGKVDPPKGKIELDIGRDRKDRKKISVNTDQPRNSISYYKLRTLWDEFSLVDVQILTGRTHQIRVHMSNINHQLVGDEIYSGKRWKSVKNLQLAKIAHNFGRPALHSWRVAFKHPASGEKVSLEAPIPEDMQKLIRMFGKSI